ncbi:hypothetical protein U1Q18_018239, partial [Sarracenia purpurea var. burkii]
IGGNLQDGGSAQLTTVRQEFTGHPVSDLAEDPEVLERADERRYLAGDAFSFGDYKGVEVGELADGGSGNPEPYAPEALEFSVVANNS